MASFDLTSPVVLELRAARPRAREALRERVLALREPAPRFELPRLPLRRIALVAVPSLVAAGVALALVHGIVTGTGSPEKKAVPAAGTVEAPKGPPAVTELREGVPAPKALTDRSRSPIAPSTTRLQNYRAQLTIRVDDVDELSARTREAMRITRELGGYIVSARFGVAKKGRSSLVVRVPIGHVQQAISRFSELGKIAGQRIKIDDRTALVNSLTKRIDALRLQIAKIDDRLADPSLSAEERVQLQIRRARLARELHSLAGRKAYTVRRAQMATVSLALTTHKAAAAPHHSGPLGRALDDAGTILAKEAAWGLYALIVLGPLAVLAFAAFLLVRAGRRLADRRLLESS